MNRSPSGTVSSKESAEDGINKKKPRKIHIDVYCTGSEAEDSVESSPKILSPCTLHYNDQSQTTQQTIYENDHLKLQHRRAIQHEVPKKIIKSSVPISQDKNPWENHQTPLQKSTSQAEIDESKQILFNKYLGDQAQIRRFDAMRNRMKLVRKDTSDDNISSNYPNSSFSTMRDNTCSSISSALAASSFCVEDIDSTLKETNIDQSVRPRSRIHLSDSFEYENLDDQLRIKIMNQNWAPKAGNFNSPEVERKFLYEKKKLEETYLQNRQNHVPSEPSDEEGLDDFVFDDVAKLKNASSRSLNMSTTDSVSTIKYCEHPQPEETVLVRQPQVMIESCPEADSNSSTLRSHFSDFYSKDYLSRARRFGPLVGALRKPGRHIGPSRNLDCECDHCRIWMLEREQEHTRSRAMSMGAVPISRLEKWKRGSNVDD